MTDIQGYFMKLAIMSDSHENWTNLTKAIGIAHQENCEQLFFAGDLISPPGLKVLEQFNGKVHFVWGNNEGEKVNLTRMFDKSEKSTLYGDICELEIMGVKIFMNHYPKIAEIAANSGDYDLVIHGHTHTYREEILGKTRLINPGEIQGFLSGQATFIIYDTSTKTSKKIVLE